MKEIKVLRIIHTLNPAYGGPVSTIINSSEELVKKGCSIDILTNDKSQSKFSIKSKNINIINIGPSYGNYGFNLRLIFWLYLNKKKYHSIIVHGLWRFQNLIVRFFFKKKYYVFSHGQLDPYFASEKMKAIKKKIYWFLFEKKNLLNSKALLLTSENELKLLKKTYVNTNGITKKVVNYGLSYPKFNLEKGRFLFNKKFKKLINKKFFLFLGRFHKKKGCEILLNAIKNIIDKHKNIYFFLVGPDNDYKIFLKNLSNKLGINKNIVWSNMINGDLKWITIWKSYAMVLPSHGENFGVSLVESMLMKKPVITTNKVNISKIIKKTNSGIITSDNVKDFTRGIIEYVNTSIINKKKMSENSYKSFNQYFNLKKSSNKLYLLLKK